MTLTTASWVAKLLGTWHQSLPGKQLGGTKAVVMLVAAPIALHHSKGVFYYESEITKNTNSISRIPNSKKWSSYDEHITHLGCSRYWFSQTLSFNIIFQSSETLKPFFNKWGICSDPCRTIPSCFMFFPVKKKVSVISNLTCITSSNFLYIRETERRIILCNGEKNKFTKRAWIILKIGYMQNLSPTCIV